MFLNELLKESQLQEGDVQDTEVVLLPAGCKSGVDYNLVVNRDIFEDILVKYRATEPISEAILVTLGTSKENTDSVWQAMVQSEAVLNHYSNLCSEFYARRFTEAESAEDPEDEFTNETPEKSTEAEAAAKDTTEESTGEDKSSIEEEQEEEKDEQENDEDYQFFQRVAEEKEETEEPSTVDTAEVLQSAVFSDIEHDDEEDSGIDLQSVMQDSTNLNKVLGLSEDEEEDSTGESTESEVDAEDSTGNVEDVTESTEEEASGDEYTENSNDVQGALDSIKVVCDTARDTFKKYGFKNICEVVGISSTDTVKELCTLSDKVAEFSTTTTVDLVDSIEFIIDLLEEECFDLVQNGQETEVPEVLKPITKIIYEE